MSASDTTMPSLAIGGVGGSGTRLFASIATTCGYFIGDELNKALDNLWFTLLLRQPKWIVEPPTEKEIEFALEIFITMMANSEGFELSDEQLNYLKTRKDSTHYHPVETERWTIVTDAIFARRANQKAGDKNPVGWKEPNTQIFLPQIHKKIPQLKYVHIIRNGYYMAHSKNQRQVHTWSRMLGMELPRGVLKPTHSLDYWIKSNQRTIDYGKQYMPEQFYLLNYDNFCSNPQRELPKLLDFLNTGLPNSALETIYGSIERKERPAVDLAQFTQSQHSSVEQLGFTA